MSDFWGVQESIVSIHTLIKSSKKANIFIENVNSSDKVFLLMVTDTDAFEVYPSSGRIKGKGMVSVTVERLSTDAEIGVAVIVRECSYEVPDDDDDCWHCIFENEPSQKHMFLKIIDFNHNFFGMEQFLIEKTFRVQNV
ncbi:hypothetical protein TNCT_488641 [Trichonephila clavata]|uniref:Uncharacterized protein n=1 Tax=Trichonephila clavata TaxID=2740835 RepID=A0A8X6G989_TRICU|nr:hypothetical protein TNCT_488641 [Trichonephila clavata]